MHVFILATAFPSARTDAAAWPDKDIDFAII